MAMSTTPDHSSTGAADLDLAIARLRRMSVPRAVEIADVVLDAVLSTPRRAEHVRARQPHDHLEVSTIAITAELRARLDSALHGAAVGRVVPDVDRDGRLRTLTLELFVRYGTHILTLADEARLLTRDTLANLLGEETGSGDPVAVGVTHIHVSDVTVGDPALIDPADD
jgi:hypothetical protein